MNLAELAGTDLGTQVCSYDERDAILYALAVGAHSTDLDLVYEKQLKVLPTYSLALGLWSVWAAGALGAYNPAVSLHVGQELVVLHALPPAAGIATTAQVGNVWDKGSAAVVEVDVASDYFTAKYTIFLPGAGGFGGERGERAASVLHDGNPDVQTSVATSPDQAALYRLTGDLHPVHIDPVAAQGVGFDRPILHGLCTLGAVALAVPRTAGLNPLALQSLTARFSAPVYPGSQIDITGWHNSSGIDYQAEVQGVGQIISGSATFD